MPLACTTGALMSCSFGAAPTSLVVIPEVMVSATMNVATIMDYLPMGNIPTFGMCSSIANPMVAAATAAALGVLTPMPCVPMTVAPWVPGSPPILTGGMPTLNNSCKAMCLWAGVISINFAGQTAVTLSQ